MMPVKGFQSSKDTMLHSPKKFTTLNPNATEFVPSSLRFLSGNPRDVEARTAGAPRTSGQAVLYRSGSNASSNSDEEAHRYWCHQLPDDIAPDFTHTVEDDVQMSSSISLSGLNIHHGNHGTNASRSHTLWGRQVLDRLQSLSIQSCDDISLNRDMGYSGLKYMGDQSTAALKNYVANPSDSLFIDDNQHVGKGRKLFHHTEVSNVGFLKDLENEQAGLKITSADHLKFLSSQFPCFAAERLADLYYASGCDLNHSIEILTRIKRRVGDGTYVKRSPHALSASSHNALDYPALPLSDSKNAFTHGEYLQRTLNAPQSLKKEEFYFKESKSSGTPRGAPDLGSAARNFTSWDLDWKSERNNWADTCVGSSGPSHSVSSSCGNGKSVCMDKVQNISTGWTTPFTHEGGDSMGNKYSEEAHDLAKLRKRYLEQARQAHLVGNKISVKELSVDRQVYNMQMKAADETARETKYQQKISVAPDVQGHQRLGQDPLIDIRNLHVPDLIDVLKHELDILRKTARSAKQCLQVMIFAGQYTKGSCFPPRVPLAVEQYLVDEGLPYAETQPGLLRVLVD